MNIRAKSNSKTCRRLQLQINDSIADSSLSNNHLLQTLGHPQTQPMRQTQLNSRQTIDF